MRFLVVVHPGPLKPDAAQQAAYMLKRGVTARYVDARNARAAADQCEVEPGGKVQVAARDDVETFTRAERAPLVSDRGIVEAA